MGIPVIPRVRPLRLRPRSSCRRSSGRVSVVRAHPRLASLPSCCPCPTLSLRQLPLYSRDPPQHLVSHISKDKLAKSQAYGRDKALFSLFSLAWGQASEFALVYFDGFAHIWQYSQHIIGPNYAGGVSHHRLPLSIRMRWPASGRATKQWRAHRS